MEKNKRRAEEKQNRGIQRGETTAACLTLYCIKFQERGRSVTERKRVRENVVVWCVQRRQCYLSLLPYFGLQCFSIGCFVFVEF